MLAYICYIIILKSKTSPNFKQAWYLKMLKQIRAVYVPI